MKYLIALLATFTIVLQVQAGIQEDLVEFDRAFIPVWYHTYSDDLPKAVNGLPLLEAQWKNLKAGWKAEAPQDQYLDDIFTIIENRLEETADALSEHNLALAYNQLDHIKYELMELRRQQGIRYQLDDLYNFHEMVFHVICIADDDLLDLMEWREFERVVHEMNIGWTLLARMDFGKSGGAYKHQFTEALLDFNQNMETAQQLAVQKSGLTLKDAAFDLLIPFGNFQFHNQELLK